MPSDGSGPNDIVDENRKRGRDNQQKDKSEHREEALKKPHTKLEWIKTPENSNCPVVPPPLLCLPLILSSIYPSISICNFSPSLTIESLAVLPLTLERSLPSRVYSIYQSTVYQHILLLSMSVCLHLAFALAITLVLAISPALLLPLPPRLPLSHLSINALLCCASCLHTHTRTHFTLVSSLSLARAVSHSQA